MPNKARAAAVIAIGVAAAATCGDAVLSMLIAPAAGHSWYPHKCCGGHDCARVDAIEPLPDGDLLFRAGPISVVVPAEFMRLPSPDNDTHVCVYRVGSGEYRPRCVFVPGVI